MRVLAIGDIHGNLSALNALLQEVQPTADDLIVTLGDYVDGLDSPGVIDRLLSLGKSNRLVAIRGNHDQLMLNARTEPTELILWQALGGDTTLACYPDESIESVPEAHWRFLEEICVNWHETDTHIFVHAHLEPELPPSDQSIWTLQWKSIATTPCLAHSSGKTIICGHKSQKSGNPLDLGHTICIDTIRGGWLSCLDVTSGQVCQANERGKVRGGSMRKP
jgi:serine/threonine protein phosphatase 1